MGQMLGKKQDRIGCTVARSESDDYKRKKYIEEK
jgi:hypothetical protein